MIWQDLVFTAGTIVFAAALLPSLFGKNKPELSTSLTTGSVSAVFAFTYFSLHLVFSSILTGVNSLFWFILAVQVYIRNKKVIKEI